MLASDEGIQADSGLSRGEAPRERLSADVVQEIHRAFAAELFAFLSGVLRNADAANEAVQSTFRRLIEVGHEARAESIKGWLFKVGFNEAMASRRKAAADERVIKGYVARRETPTSNVSLNTAAYEDLVLREDLERLKKLLPSLPSEQLMVLKLRVYEEKTFAEIASHLKLPLGTVLTRMRLAMEKLQKWMNE